MAYRPGFTGLGILSGYLAVLLGLSFYLRRRIGAKRWRKVHRLTAVVWLMSVIHAIGAGSAGSSLWLRTVALAPVPLVYLLIVRPLESRRRPKRARPHQPHSLPSLGRSVAGQLEHEASAAA